MTCVVLALKINACIGQYKQLSIVIYILIGIQFLTLGS